MGADYTKQTRDTEDQVKDHEDELAEQNRRMAEVNQANIDRLKSAQQTSRTTSREAEASEDLDDRMLRQQRSAQTRILPSARDQIPAAKREVVKAVEQVDEAQMSVAQANYNKYPATSQSATVHDSHKSMTHKAVTVAGLTALASVFKHAPEQSSATSLASNETATVKTAVSSSTSDSNETPTDVKPRHLMSPATEIEQLKAAQDNKLTFLSKARRLQRAEKVASPKSIDKVHKDMRLLAASELYPKADVKTLTPKQLTRLNGDVHQVMSTARQHATTDLHDISSRLSVLNAKVAKDKTPRANPNVDVKSTKPDNDKSKMKPVTVSNDALGLSNPGLSTATAERGMPIDAKVENAGTKDKQVSLDDQMHNNAGKTAANVDQRVMDLEAKLAEMQAENAQLRDQQVKRDKPSFVERWKANQAKFEQSSTKSLVAAAATRLGKATLRLSGKVVIASLGAVAAVGYLGARKATEMSTKIKAGMDESMMRGVDPALRGQVDLGK